MTQIVTAMVGSPPVDVSPPRVGLRARAVRGSAWLVIGYIAAQALRLGTNIVLAYLLAENGPMVFAVMGLVNVMLMGLEMLCDLGTGVAIVQSRRGEERAFLDTAWTIQAVRGVGLWLAACAVAWPMGILYYPQLVELLPIVGLSAVLAGLSSTSLALAVRRMDFGRLTAIELAAQVVSILVMVPLAWMYRSVWALAVGALAAAAVKLVLSHTALPGAGDRLRWDPRCARELVVFGRWIFVSTAATFLAVSADRLLLGVLTSADVLGVYFIAFSLATIPTQVTAKLIGGVLYSVLSQVHRTEPSQLRRKFYAARSLLLRVGSLAVLTVTLAAKPFFGLLYHDRYAQAGPMAQLIAISVWFMLLQRSADRLIPAMGDARPLAVANWMNLIVTVPAAVIGYRQWGMAGFLLGYAAGNATGYLMIASSLSRRGVPILTRDMLWTTALLLAALGGLAAQRMTGLWVDGDARQLLMAAVAGVILAPAGVWIAMRLKRELWNHR